MCDVCEDTGFLAASWVFGRELRCTCLPSGLLDEMTLHAPDCDGVPCPFDQLVTPLGARVLE